MLGRGRGGAPAGEEQQQPEAAKMRKRKAEGQRRPFLAGPRGQMSLSPSAAQLRRPMPTTNVVEPSRRIAQMLRAGGPEKASHSTPMPGRKRKVDGGGSATTLWLRWRRRLLDGIEINKCKKEKDKRRLMKIL